MIKVKPYMLQGLEFKLNTHNIENFKLHLCKVLSLTRKNGAENYVFKQVLE